MIFAAPGWLVLLALVPLLALAEALVARRDRARLSALVARPLWSRVLRRSSERWRYLRLGLLLLGGTGLVLALARPQWGIVRERVEREGADVVFVLDTSGSMAVEDVAPNRFFLARAALTNLAARLLGDRFALVAFEGEAYALVPLTLDADALGLFLETLEPGAVPAPGTSVGAGLERGMSLFVDPERRHKVLVLVSDGENLEGDVDAAIARAKQAGVVVHSVGVGTPRGQPVPDLDREGRVVGFKKDASGSVVVSRLHTETLEAIARGTGGRYFQITPADTSLAALAGAIEGLEQRSLAREFSYRKKERFQVPLGIGLGALTLGLLLPLPRLRRASAALALVLVGLCWPASAQQTGGFLDELLLRPRRLTNQGRGEWERGDHPGALAAFQEAAKARPGDPRAKFNLADGLYKNGKLDEAAQLWRALGQDARAPLAGAARFNLGNSLYAKQDYPGAIRAYRDALQVLPGDEATRRNLELALRAQQQEQQQQQQQQQRDQQRKPDQQKQDQQNQPQSGDQKQPPRPKSQQEQEQERYQKEAGMPKERAMQLLEALQQNEKAEQRKRLKAASRKRTEKDW